MTIFLQSLKNWPGRYSILLFLTVLFFLPSICFCDNSEQNIPTHSYDSETSVVLETNSSSIRLPYLKSVYYNNNSFFSSSQNQKDSSNSTDKNNFRQRAFVDLTRCAKTTVSDFGTIYSSPFSMNKRNLMIAGGLLLTGGVIYHYDQEIHDMFMRNKNEPFYKPINNIGEFFEPCGLMRYTNPVLITSLITGYIFDNDFMMSNSADILESFILTGVPKNILNYAIGRRRPSAGMGPRNFELGDGTAFPSGHTLVVVHTACILSYHIDNLIFKTAAYGMATSVCLQRITSESHWPSDVYSSALIGWFVSRELIGIKKNRNIIVTPTFDVNSQGVGLQAVFRF